MENIIVFGIGAYFEKKKAAIRDKWHIVGYIDNKINLGQKMEFEEIYAYNPDRKSVV